MVVGPNLREAVTLTTAALLFGDVLSLLPEIAAGARPSVALSLIQIFPGLPIKFEVEPLGMLFAVIASGLWIVNSLYSIGYMRGNRSRIRPGSTSASRSRWPAPWASPSPATC